jgi:hypothetical protein
MARVCGNTRQIGARSIHSLAGRFLYFVVGAASRFANQASPQENKMKKAVALIPIVLALAAASPALARAHYQHRSDPAPYSHVESDWGPPTSWSDIEISHPEGGG